MQVLVDNYNHHLGYRNLSIQEVEHALGLPADYTASAGASSVKRWVLAGNGFAIPPVVFLLSGLVGLYPPQAYPGYPYTVPVGHRSLKGHARWYPGLDSLPAPLRASLLAPHEAMPALPPLAKALPELSLGVPDSPQAEPIYPALHP